MPNIAWYITAHGYGHGARSTDLIRTVLGRAGDTRLNLVTALPEAFLASRLPRPPESHRSMHLDIGMVQLDSVRVDLDATRARLEVLCSDWERLVYEEVAWMWKEKPDLVVADIPGIPLEAAARVGIPCVAVGNFGWDWIYEEFAEGEGGIWNEAVEHYRSAYAGTDLLVQLPFSEPMKAFPRRERAPLLAHPGDDRREEVARVTGADPDATWILLSFTTLDWGPDALERVRTIPGVEWFTIEPLSWDVSNMHMIARDRVSVPDLFATVDAVVTKPGYGVLSDCAVNGKPIIHAERRHFREYPVLLDAIDRHLQGIFLTEADLYAGALEDAVSRLSTLPSVREPLEADRGAKAADLLLDLVRT